jgi:hypothetical protein
MRLFCPRLVSCLLVGIASLAIVRAAPAQCEFGVGYRTLVGSVTFGTDGSLPSHALNLLDQAVSEWAGYNADPNIAIRVAFAWETPDISFGLSSDLPSTTAGESTMYMQGGYAKGFTVINSTKIGGWTNDFLKHHLVHEVGHQFGFTDSPCTYRESVMGGGGSPNDERALTSLSSQDRQVMMSTYAWTDPNCNPTECSPVVLDLDHTDTFTFSDIDVWFDLRGLGVSQWFGWTAAGTSDGFLVLDRNGNGTIDNGRELFGNSTPYSLTLDGPSAKHGFDALRWLDGVGQGGNANGWIDPGDEIYASLRIWVDANHDGISQAGELSALPAAGVAAVAVTAVDVWEVDAYGNIIKYRATYVDAGGTARAAVDVFFNNH